MIRILSDIFFLALIFILYLIVYFIELFFVEVIPIPAAVIFSLTSILFIFISFSVLSEKSRQQKKAKYFITLFFVFAYTYFTIAFAIPNYREGYAKSVQKSAIIELQTYIASSKAFLSENNKLPKNTREVSTYTSVKGCKKDIPKFCRKNQPLDYSGIKLKKWFNSSGYYQIEIKNKADTVYFLAKPTGYIRKYGYGVVASLDQSGNGKVIDLPFKGDDFGIENYKYKFPSRKSQNRYEKFLLCYENAQSEKDINLRTKKENKCQRERFSNYPKLRDSFKD